MRPDLYNESFSDESSSFSDVFSPSSSYVPQLNPVRASTPLSSVSDISTNTKDTTCSFLPPQDFSLVSEDLSLCSPDHEVTNQSVYQSDPIDGQVEAVFPPVPSGYVHGSLWYGFKIVGDNLDKTIKPRDMRSNHQSQSLHYFNLYAVRDRIDYRPFSCESSIIDPTEVDLSVFVPSAADMDSLLTNITILVSRILCEYFPTLSEYSSSVTQHIPHKYSKEMSTKSHVVST